MGYSLLKRYIKEREKRRYAEYSDDKEYGTVTLTSSSATTVVNNCLVTDDSRIFLYPTAVDSVTDFVSATGVYVSSKLAGTSFTISHPNNAATGKTFDYLIVN